MTPAYNIDLPQNDLEQTTEKVSILLVDDQPGKLLAHQSILTDLGANIVVARSGREALNCLLHEEFAVILLDVNMPEMDGFETATMIRQHPRFEHTPIIFITAYSTSDLDRLKGYDLGAVDFLFLPVIPEILRAKVKVFVELAAQKQLIEARDELERRVEERTSELRHLNEELVRSNKELEAFAYIASHDLQEPLRMITSYVQLIQRSSQDVQLTDETSEYLREVKEAAERMRQLINDLLDYSRVRTRLLECKPHALSHIVEKVIQNLQVAIRESKAEIHYENLPTLSVDEFQLVQIFQNLVSNAIKFRGNKPPRINISAVEQDGYWRFCVKDDGIGIAPEHHERIFKIFQRLHSREEYTGTGIGLAICRLAIERHGGTIWVESEVGKGSSFYLTLPRSPKNESTIPFRNNHND
jgi:two-component system, sensor histidine kinase and response regulator